MTDILGFLNKFLIEYDYFIRFIITINRRHYIDIHPDDFRHLSRFERNSRMLGKIKVELPNWQEVVREVLCDIFPNRKGEIEGLLELNVKNKKSIKVHKPEESPPSIDDENIEEINKKKKDEGGIDKEKEDLLTSEKDNELFQKQLTSEEAERRRKELVNKDFKNEYLDKIITNNKRMFKVFEEIVEIKDSNEPILIYGESGTGKELIAQLIHNSSKRSKEGLLIPIDCGGLNQNLSLDEFQGHIKGSFTSAVSERKGALEEADKGTLFLDEIGNLNLEIQAQLLRIIDGKEVVKIGDAKKKSRKIDFRVIAATNKNLKEAIKSEKFINALYQRISTFSFTLPPLRERKEDIPLLARNFLKLYNSEQDIKKDINTLSEAAIKCLQKYSWAEKEIGGNIRELRKVIIQAYHKCKTNEIKINDLPDDVKEYTKAFESTDKKSVFVELLKEAWIKLGCPPKPISKKRGVKKEAFLIGRARYDFINDDSTFSRLINMYEITDSEIVD